MTEGCHGATIPCSASGMSPCRHCGCSEHGSKDGTDAVGCHGAERGSVAADDREGPSSQPSLSASLLPVGASEVMSVLSNAGFPCHAVGGCVRDALLGRVPHDWDLTTSATVDEMEWAFRVAGLRTYGTGVEHGTITVVGSDGDGYEVTTYRIDGEYSDGRHPDSVMFTDSLEADLARRDLTINAIAWSPDGGIADPFGGRDDIRDGVIRAVGDSRERMLEDSLRVMRAMRFSAVLGFGIAPDTASAIHDLAPLLSRVSQERKRDELTKMLATTNVASLSRNLREYQDVIFEVIPELADCAATPQRHPWHRFDNVWDHIVEVVASTPEDPIVRMAALLHDVGKPSCLEVRDDGSTSFRGHPSVGAEIAKAVMANLRFDGDTASKVVRLVAEHDRNVQPTRKSVRRALSKFGDRETFDRWWELRRADVMGQSEYAQGRELPHLDAVRRLADELEEEEGVLSISDMRLRGSDLIGMGMRPGPDMGRLLREAFDLVLDGTLPNESDPLREFAVKRIGTL